MYLSMIMKATPSVFNDLFRLRVGLIIQVYLHNYGLLYHLQAIDFVKGEFLSTTCFVKMIQKIGFLIIICPRIIPVLFSFS